MKPHISFSLHAIRQLEERDITKELVSKILRDPDQVVKGEMPGREIAQKLAKRGAKKMLYRVIFVRSQNCYHVLTAYRTSKIEKYFERGE